MIKYNKIIRVKIPEIIEQNGKSCKYDVVDKHSLDKSMLFDKMKEEIYEVGKADSQEEIVAELGDVFEVFQALCAYHNVELDEVISAAEAKNATNGKFITEDRKFLILKEVS